jgi:glucosamine-6-phosphate isomerase
MKLIIEDTYEQMSVQAAADMLTFLQTLESPLICPASGNSPAALYSALHRLVQQEKVDISAWKFIGLDEWKGMNGGDEGSCRSMLNEQLFYPLQIPPGNIFFFNGKAPDLAEECMKAEQFIQQHGGIKVAIVGIGMNGHIGMNEPGTPASARSHVAVIHPLTQKVGQKYFAEPKQLDEGLTLGIGTLLESQKIYLIANGRHKAGVIKQMLTDSPGERFPATQLKDHPGLSLYLDKEAASML